MTSITKSVLHILLAAVATPAGAWWDPGHLVDISTANLYGIPTAFKAKRPGVNKVALIAERRIAADRAVALAAAGGFPWLDGPYGLFLVDTSSGEAIKEISVFDSASPNNIMPGIKAAGPGYVIVTMEDPDSAAELSRQKYFFDESTAPAKALSYKPFRLKAVTHFNGSLYFTGQKGDDGVIIRQGLKDDKPVPGDWEIVETLEGKKIQPLVFSKAEGGILRLYSPTETYAHDGKTWTRSPVPDIRYFRPPQETCSFPMDDMVKHQELYEKCEKERYAQGDAGLVGYDGRCETDNPGEYSGLPNSYFGRLERHEVLRRVINIPGAPGRRLFVYDAAQVYEPVTGIYEVRKDYCKFYPMPVPDKEVLKRYRPDRAKDGCGINDKMGPFQILGDRVWFCKNFYGGEGECGVGAAGFFDTKAKVFEIFYSSQTAPWSCSSILAEEKTVWMGLEHVGEGWGKAGGLAALDPATGEVKIFDIPAGITAIQRLGDRLILVTGEGIYLLDAKGEVSFLGSDIDVNGIYQIDWKQHP